MYTDPSLAEAARDDPDREMDVVLGCDRYSPDVRAQLERIGVRVVDDQAADVGVVHGRMRLSVLPQLDALSEITSIEPDSEQEAFG